MNKHVRVITLMVIDAILIAGSVYTAYLLRFDFSIRAQFIPTLPYVITSYILITLVWLYVHKTYRRIWQYASIGDLISIFKGVIISSVTFYILHQVFLYFGYTVIVPRSIYILSIGLIFFSVGGSRFFWRIFRDNYIKIQPHHLRALIIGAGDAGIMVVKELKHTKSEIYPVAFIDDNMQKQNLELMGVPVVGNRSDISKVVENYNIQDIIIALPSATRTEIADILELCKRTGARIKMIPRMNDLINGKISINMIRNVSVEDLLGRDPVQVDLKEISDYLSNHVVLVTGAGGSIGSELSRQIAGFKPKQLLLLGHGENSIYDIELELRKKYPHLKLEPLIADIQDKDRLIEIFDLYRPHVVFHAAAHKHVPMMERNPIEAIKNNILGTKNVADCAHEFDAERFVMISTDKAVNPTNVMGATKRIAEMIVQSMDQKSNTRYAAVRFGNVLGSRGSVIPIFKRQIEEGGPVTVTHPDMVRYFMTIPEAVQLVIQTGALSQGGDVFILDMGKPVKIADLARDLIRLSGLEPNKDIKIEFTGIRPGEKLFEEILTSEEGTAATKHDRIYVGKPSQLSSEQLEQMIKRFNYMILNHNRINHVEVRELLKMWVPSYHWRQAIDKDTRKAFDEAYQMSLETVAAVEKK
jgi:FlaA1/EpsC-like NDP-sugar epimerase